MNYKSKIEDYLTSLYESFESIKIDTSEINDKFDEEVLGTIKSFASQRDTFIELLRLICLIDTDDSCFESTFRFFESTLSYLHFRNLSPYEEMCHDNYKIIVRELFLYLITLLIKYNKYGAIDIFLDNLYYNSKTNFLEPSSFYHAFYSYPESLEVIRKKRLNINSLSLMADLLKQRANVNFVPFNDIMQTDFILFLRSQFFKDDDEYGWFPITLVYATHSTYFSLFRKAESKLQFQVLKKILKVKDKNDLIDKINSKVKNNQDSWLINHRTLHYEVLMNLQKLDTK